MEAKSSKNIVRFIDDDDEDLENLKRRISSHPLYGLLIETHLDCLKVGLGEIEEVGRGALNQDNTTSNISMSTNLSDLDHFMETYNMALSELKEVIKESLQGTRAFINGMQFQLKELMTTHHQTHSTPTTSSGEKISGTHYKIKEHSNHIINNLDEYKAGDEDLNCGLPSRTDSGPFTFGGESEE